MNNFLNFLILLGGFAVVAVASNQIARLFQKIKLPFVTGLLFMGMLAGPFLLKLIPYGAKDSLRFISDTSLAFIAFAASGELYLKELRGRLKSIKWMTFWQLLATFSISSVAVYFLSDHIPFMQSMGLSGKIAVAILMGSIFVARSPASAIAVINEMRAKGAFTQTAIGVTVLIDFSVIILFTVNYSVATALIQQVDLDFMFIGILLLEIATSFLLGYILGHLLQFILKQGIHKYAKTAYILLSGYGVYALYYFVKSMTELHFGKAFLVEPLLICIVGSFFVTNFSKYRPEFTKIIDDIGPVVYIAFFTLTGASVALNILVEVLSIALILFGVRVTALIVGAYLGGKSAGDPPLFSKIGWMPYVTQAGVALGLSTVVAKGFPEWGQAFALIVVAVVVINEISGPPLFKWAITIVKEGHRRADVPVFDGVRDAIIFGFESQSVALARQLQKHGWAVKVATFKNDINPEEYPGLDIRTIKGIDMDALDSLDAGLSEAIVLMLTDLENYQLCELIYENIGTKDVIVRLNQRYNFDKFHGLGALIVDPSTAIVSLLDHFVRSPQAASLLLGMQEGQDTIDLEVLNPGLHGLSLRDLQLPSDIIILSVKRAGQMLITHGYTRLRMGDQVTVVGSVESLQNLTLRFDRPASS